MKLLEKKELTTAQYIRANRTMGIILALSYLMYMIVEMININKVGLGAGLFVRCGVYVIALIGSGIVYRFMKNSANCMRVFTALFLIA